MSDIAKRLGAPPLPAVNLLPRDIAEKRQMRAVQLTALLVVAVAIGVVVIAYVLALGTRALADEDLADARAAQALAVADRDAKAAVYDAYRDQEIEEYTLAQIGFGEIDYTQLSTAVLATANDETSFDSVTFDLPTGLGYNNVATDPVLGGGIGALAFTARAESQVAATALVSRIEEVPGVARVVGRVERFTTDAGTAAYWEIEGTAVVTDLRLTGRLLPVDGITGLDPSTIVPDIPGAEEGAQPAPTPEPSPTATEGES